MSRPTVEVNTLPNLEITAGTGSMHSRRFIKDLGDAVFTIEFLCIIRNATSLMLMVLYIHREHVPHSLHFLLIA